MKQMKYILSMALFAAVAVGCDDHASFDNNVYINASSKTNSVLLKSTIETAERTFQVALAKPEERDVTITIKADASLVGTYNEGYYDEALILPDGYYTISDPEVTINAGSVRSTGITVSFDKLNDLDREQKYVLPVTIDNANVGILQSARTMYYVFKAAALINVVADLEKNNVYVNWAKPEVVIGMRQLTAEALIYVRNFDKMLSTVMGIEGQFLIRIGDSGIPSNQLQIATSNGNFTSSGLAIPTNEWVHIAMTYDADATTINVYINGKNLYTTTEADADAVNWGVEHSDESDGKPRCFWIGYSYNSDRYLAGMISECRLWNRVLTYNEINATNHFYEVKPDSEGLVAYWKLDDGGGQKITDYSVNENHATASNAVTWASVELPAK
jgi:hypothetical protein